MGYSIYWSRPVEIERETFLHILEDFQHVLPVLTRHHRVRLAGGCGQGEPELNEYKICFNGKPKCGHRRSRLSHGDFEIRDCGGSCVYETFSFPRIDCDYLPAHGTLLHHSCKTNRRHYELAAQVVLIAAKYHLGKEFGVCGLAEHWQDARSICHQYLGYGTEMDLFEAPGELIAPRRPIREPFGQLMEGLMTGQHLHQ